MKRGKDDDKVMGPMFPRLHVNDAVKGGPRAPPRNKMALYEQLTIPSQRMHSLPHGSTSTVAPSASTIQGNSHEQNTYFPRYRPQSTSSYNEPQVNRSETVDLSNQLALGENRKQPLDEDDFMVPIFSQPGVQACDGNPQNSVHDERQIHVVLDNSTTLPSTGDEEINHNRDLITKKRSSRISNAPRGYSSDILVSEEDGMLWKKDACTRIGYEEKCRMSSSKKTGIILRQDHDDVISVLDSGANGLAILDQPLENHAEDISLRLSYNAQVGCRSRGDKGDNNIDNGLLQVEVYQSLEKENTDKEDDVSEASVVETVTGLDICPDDVVRVIGPKHFWKARTAIANQQRVFAVQVFELHRLLKVQKLIAESPELLLGSALMGKSSFKGSTVKKYPSDDVIKAVGHKSATKDVSYKVIDKVEGTAENAVTKSPPMPLQNAIQPALYRSSSVNAASSFPPVNLDPKMNQWSFPQPGPHQWLVPVMSPSEGLVYKPYPAPGFGPGDQTPVINQGFGMPTPHYQGMVMPPGMHFGGQGYFPPYGMPMPIPMPTPMPMPMPIPMMTPSMSGSTVEQLNPFPAPNPSTQMGQPLGTNVNFGSMQQQGSLNIPSQKNVTVTPIARPQSPKEREVQGSTASSPSQRTQAMCRVPLVERGDALSLFPAAPMPQVSEKPTRVIRVVPHKPGSTRESAARIFQSIQEERRHFE